MPFGEGTHSKRRFRPYTLDLYIKVQVWGRMVRASLQVPSIPKVIQKNDDVSSTLLYNKKRRKKGERGKTTYIYIKRELKREKRLKKKKEKK
jgi:hypothetical protein